MSDMDRAERRSKRAAKKTRRFLMPDAPRPTRRRRGPSPVRAEPVFAEGVPHTLPPTTTTPRWFKAPRPQGPSPTTEHPVPSSSPAPEPLPRTEPPMPSSSSFPAPGPWPKTEPPEPSSSSSPAPGLLPKTEPPEPSSSSSSSPGPLPRTEPPEPSSSSSPAPMDIMNLECVLAESLPLADGNQRPDPSPIDDVDVDFIDGSEDWAIPDVQEDDSDSDVAMDDGDGGPINTASGEVVFQDCIDEAIVQRLEMNDATDDAAMRGIATGVSPVFDWVHDASKFQGKREAFTGTAGPTFPRSDLKRPLDAFLKVWDLDIMNQIVNATNRYAVKTIDTTRASGHLAPSSRLKSWVPLTVEELYVFFSLLIVQSLSPLTVESDYFYSTKPTTTHCFAPYMSYNRFVLIKRLLYFVDPNLPIPSRSEEKKMHEIQPVVKHLKHKFSSLYMPGQNICIDESLMKWMGPLSFSQKMATKAAHIGLKSYELCESETGYLWDFIPYTGKSDDTDAQTNRPTLGAIPQIVCDLSRPLWGKGHTLVMDNYYNSPLLARHLKSQRTDCFGTLRINREFVAESIKQAAKSTLRVGEVVTTNTEDLTVIAWRDSNVVCMISTFHGVEIGVTDKHGRGKYKPLVVMDYNKLMGGVDLKDQLLAAFKMVRDRNAKWYKKYFRQLLNVSILNCRVMYQFWGSKTSHRVFREDLVNDLLSLYGRRESLPGQVRTISQTVATNSRSNYALQKVKGNHFIEKNQGNQKRRCYWCSRVGKTSRTQYWCDVCKVPLCMFPCFKDAHI